MNVSSDNPNAKPETYPTRWELIKEWWWELWNGEE